MVGIYGGIDFGTTNSSAALSETGKIPYMVSLEGRNITIPTALFFGDNKTISFGREAMRRYMLGEQGRCMRSIKRILGTSLMKSGTMVNGRSVRFEDILKCFLRYLKQRMDEAAGKSVDNVVLGRPVHFRDNDADGDARAEAELRQAAREIGFAEIAFQYEPIAAADFEAAIRDELQKLEQTLRECLLQSGVAPVMIELVILTGGSTEIPVLQRCVRRIFPQAKLSQENKLSSVGLGLAYDSRRRFG